MDENNADNVTLAAELTAAWLANPNTRVQAEEVPNFLNLMHATLKELSAGGGSTVGDGKAAPEAPVYEGAVTVRKSLSNPDHILSMIDGKPYKMLTRHLSANGLTPAEYRARYGLKPDYPMTATNYSAMRKELAKKIGLGRKPGEKVVKKAATAPKAPRAAKKAAAPAAE
jgi:predicted transcriptional regulator